MKAGPVQATGGDVNVDGGREPLKSQTIFWKIDYFLQNRKIRSFLFGSRHTGTGLLL